LYVNLVLLKMADYFMGNFFIKTKEVVYKKNKTF